MKKHIVVAGCRYYENYDEAKLFIETCLEEFGEKNNYIFLSGGCTGADLLGERFARENGYQIQHYPAQWKKYGRAAGPKRNLQMAKDCDYVICFWDGESRGTASMISCAKNQGKEIKIKTIKKR